MNIGFIGLGNMGSGMANNLLKFCQNNDHILMVRDIKQSMVDAFVAKGAFDPQSIEVLAQEVDVVFTSLPTSKEVAAVALGEEGLLENLKHTAVWFETSTNDLSEWEKIRAQSPDYLSLVDAPVTGGAEGAAAGTLTMLLGVDEDILRRHADLLASITSKAIRMGPAGAGYVTKLCQLHLNYLVAQGIGEALMLGAKANLNLEVLHSVLQNSCAQSYVVDSYIPKILDGSYDPSFTLGLATKDMRLISQLGEHLEVPMVLADQVYQSYERATEAFGSDQAHLQIVRLLEEQLGQELRS